MNRLHHKERIERTKAPPASVGGIILTLTVLGLTLYVLGSVEGRETDRIAIWVYIGVPLLLLALGIGKAVTEIRRYRDATVLHALHRSDEGDSNGAIEELLQEIEEHGPTANRVNGLAVLYLKKKDYAAAEHWCRKGLSIDFTRFDLRANFAVCRLRTGHVEEAEAILAELTAGPAKHQPAVLESHALALIALNRLDEAEAMLDRAEADLKKGVYLTTLDVKGPIRAEITDARAEIAAMRSKANVHELDSNRTGS